jgi:hypothetical protein
MLRNSCLFDKTGNVKLTRDNQDILVQLSTFEPPKKLSDAVDQIKAKVDKLSISNAMRTFCVNNGYKMPIHVLPHLKQLFVIRACYIVEKDCLKTSWNDSLTTPLKSITKTEQKIIQMLKSKNTNLYDEKVKTQNEMHKEIEYLKESLALLDVTLDSISKNVSQMSITNPFLKKCYKKAVEDNTNKPLYYLLDKYEKEQYKKCIGSDREKFEFLEQWKGKKIEKNLLLSKLKDMEHKYNILIRSIEELSCENIEDEEEINEEKEKEKEDKKEEEQREVPESWEDF